SLVFIGETPVVKAIAKSFLFVSIIAGAKSFPEGELRDGKNYLLFLIPFAHAPTFDRRETFLRLLFILEL
ncbi:MAG: hypothetical protein J6T14_01975, partial [Clostridia bacterium]|nr:hypothetical protein [Clostridia bacterium]